MRNQVTSELRNARKQYFTEKIASAKSTAAYWNLLAKATNPVRRSKIGPLTNADGSLVVNDKDKADLFNNIFANIGTKVARTSYHPLQQRECTSCIAPLKSNITVTENMIHQKLKAIKVNKSAGPDCISPKLLKLAERAIVRPLTRLFSLCAQAGETFNDWKKARLVPVFKKDDATDVSNYRPISLLSVPSKIMESCVSDTIVHHVRENNLISDKQWAYRMGHSTELMLVHLSEKWGRAIDENKVIAAAFVDFRKAFDCVSHKILLNKLKHQFGIRGSLLTWLTDYLSDRYQVTIVNGQQSDVAKVNCGIPQGSVLGPTLFTLYTNDLPTAVHSGTTLMYADDTTLYCSGDTVDDAVTLLNHALIELYNWCSENNLSPHATKCEAMLLTKTQFIGPLNSVIIGKERIEWVNHTRLVGVTIDHRLSWSRHLNDVKKSFLNKLNLLKRSSFLSKNALLDLYFKVILPSVLYGLIVWGGCINAEQLNSLEILHRRAARVIYKLPKDLPSSDVYQHTNWDTIDYMYKLRLIKLFYKIVSEESPPTLSYLVNRPFTNYNLRNCNRITVP